jgi:hypothetical protein
MWQGILSPTVGDAGSDYRSSLSPQENTYMTRHITHSFHLVLMLGMFVLFTAIPASGHGSSREEVTLSDDPSSCVDNVKPELLGSTPSEVEGYSLVTARVTFAPGGSLGAHIHPGTLVATVVEGTLGFTLISDAQMDVNRAPAADGSRATDVAMPGEEVILDVGDGFVETGMVHSARNASDVQTVVIISGLVETGQPLTQCVEQ